LLLARTDASHFSAVSRPVKYLRLYILRFFGKVCSTGVTIDKCDVFFRHNSSCANEITALAVTAVPSLMAHTDALPPDLLSTLLTSLLEVSKVHVRRTYTFYRPFLPLNCGLLFLFLVGLTLTLR